METTKKGQYLSPIRVRGNKCEVFFPTSEDPSVKCEHEFGHIPYPSLNSIQYDTGLHL